MTANEAITWFEQIEAKQIARVQSGTYMMSNRPAYDYDDTEAIRWITEAQSALEAVFPDAHAVLKSWRAIVSTSGGNSQVLSSSSVVECVLRAMPISDSGASRSPIPEHADHSFRLHTV